MSRSVTERTRLKSKERHKVSRYLKKMRLKQGLTQAMVAQSLGYHPQYVANWESGRSSPPMSSLAKISDVLKIPRKELLDVCLEDQEDKFKKILNLK